MECHKCHNLWLSTHLRCWTTTTSPRCRKSAMRVANTNVFDLQANFNDKIHFCLTTVLLKVLGMQLQIISLEHLDHVIKSWKNALRTLKHIFIKTSSEGFAIQGLTLRSMTSKVLAISATLAQALSSKVWWRVSMENVRATLQCWGSRSV